MHPSPELRVAFPSCGLDPDDYCSVELVIAPALRHVGEYVCAESLGAASGALTPGQLALLAIHGCYCEVANGGFHQFFWNGGCEVAQAALAGFETAGMVREAALLRRAMALVPGGMTTGTRDDICARLEKIDYDSWRRLADPINAEWYQLSDGQTSIPQLVTFIISRRSEFFIN